MDHVYDVDLCVASHRIADFAFNFCYVSHGVLYEVTMDRLCLDHPPVLCVIVISRFLKRYSKAKRTRAPAYSRVLRRIKMGLPKGGSIEAQVRFPEYQYV